jgi:hypothetical protein
MPGAILLPTRIHTYFLTQVAVPPAIKKVNDKTYHQPYHKAQPVGITFLRHEVKTAG